MVRTVKLMISTNEKNGKDLIERKFRDLSWWSDNMETVAHYYEGCAMEMEVQLDSEREQEYIRCGEDCWMIDLYTYGFMKVKYPKGATWYSFSSDYLKENVISIKEIFPDLSEFNE